MIETLKNITIGQILAHLTSVLATIAIIWTVGKPHAEEFVKDTVSNERFASERSLEEIKKRLNAVEGLLQEFDTRVETSDRVQGVIRNDIDTLKDLQKEQSRDIKNILRGINRLEQ